MVTLLALLRDGGLATMAGGETPAMSDAGGPTIQAVRLVCQIDLEVAGLRWTVTRHHRDPETPAFERLAGELLARGGELAISGTEATSLEDGLEKVARGELAPETLTLLVHRLPGRPDAEAAEAGWLLRVSGTRATARRHDPVGGLSEPRALDLDTSEVEALAGRLAERGIGVLPTNLRTPAHTELTLAVLNRSRTFQARPSSTPTTEGPSEPQRTFDLVVEELAELYQQVEMRRK